MTAAQPTPESESRPTYWQAPSATGPNDQLLPRLRVRLVGLVAAMVVQATIALMGVLPDVPGVRDLTDSFYRASQPEAFWIQFAVIEFLAALVVSFSFGPGVSIGDVPIIGRLVLGLGFVAVPVVAIVLGGIEAAQVATSVSSAAVASSWLSTGFFSTLFLGLPLIALMAHSARAKLDSRT